MIASSGGRRPDFKSPALACDSHCHVFGPASRFPYAPDRRYTPDDAPKEALVALHERLGLQRAVIVQASCHGNDNRAMVDCLQSDRARFRGVAIVHGAVSDAELAELHDAGVRGVRFNFVRHLGGAPDMRAFETTLAKIRPLGWHVVLHLDAPDIADLAPMISDLKLTAVIDHMGRAPAAMGVDQAPFQALLRLVELEHVWVKVSGAERIAEPPFRTAIPFARALISAAPDRVLWGTDFPHPNLKHEVDEADLVDLLKEYGDDAALRRLLVTNPARLYDFPLPEM
ncbi:amidohydrolase family protein [Terrarubrum flagellatum]|uniref:amidohydrolase family protein n=1 Tax=Terrirubrum flagellatum TaxID=2895980 RepID=UPI0031452508